jgi:hypothetical protein
MIRHTATPRTNPDDLVAQATSAADGGRLPEALAHLLAAAEQYRQTGRTSDERHCLQFSATLARLLGNPAAARIHAMRAAALSAPGSPAAVSAAAELAECALALRDPAGAAEAFRQALEHAATVPLAPAEETGLRRKYAAALCATGRPGAAITELRKAHTRLSAGGDRPGALRALVEAATAAHDGALSAEADALRAEAFEQAQAMADNAAVADLELLEAAAALRQNDPNAALAAARRAREHALCANTPVSYVAATTSIAQLQEHTGDRVGAYAALAAGYATLGDLLGPEEGRATFAPRLAELRDRWGAAEFARVKAAYEASRRPAQG